MSIFSDLRSISKDQPFSGYEGVDRYPPAFQAADFPLHGSKVRITGNNQAFFFVSGVKDASGQIVDITPNTKALERLIHNIISQGITSDDRPKVRLQIDADVFENPRRFVEKYQANRSETERSVRESLLSKEIEAIRNFIQGDGVQRLVRDAFQSDALRKGTVITSMELGALTDEFLSRNLKVEGVRSKDALQFATWEIDTAEGRFEARQEYKSSTYMTERPWQLGMQPELTRLSDKGHSGAKQISEAVAFTRGLETVDLIFGEPESAPRPQTSVSRNKPNLGSW